MTRVLVTNDDGVEAQGIHVLAAALCDKGYDVTVVAPNCDRSGASAAIGVVHADQHLDIEKVEMPGCNSAASYALDGPPALCVMAARLGASPHQVALAWLLRRSPTMVLIPGTSSVAHLEENVAAAAIRLTDEQFGALARAVPSPADSPPGTKKEQLTPLAQAIRILSGRRSD